MDKIDAMIESRAGGFQEQVYRFPKNEDVAVGQIIDWVGENVRGEEFKPGDVPEHIQGVAMVLNATMGTKKLKDALVKEGVRQAKANPGNFGFEKDEDEKEVESSMDNLVSMALEKMKIGK